MEHECFENADIAGLMNKNFVCIKVDREERPDLDQIYQNVAQAMTRSGGWPLTVFLTPELKPFFGGTYFPPEDRHGRPGFPRLIEALSKAFREDPEAVEENANKLTEMIASLESVTDAPWGDNRMPSLDRLLDAGSSLMGSVDLRDGGFGGAPKFPNPMAFAFLWRMQLAAPDGGQAREAVLTSLAKMAEGGIYDQLGGGFHRYSVDETWSVPHFEKMLYDNGLLLKLYSEVLLTPRQAGVLGPELEELYLGVLESTVTYLRTELRAKRGGFHAAQDADSEGEEGKFFVWDAGEIRSFLGEKDAALFCARYGVSGGGNFEHGKTVLFQALSVADAAKHVGMTEGDARKSLADSSAKLLAARSERVPPATDTKLLTSWNGLAISGLAWASRALAEHGREEPAKGARDLAKEAFDFVARHAGRPDGKLFATIQEGQAKLEAYLDDYAFMAMAALDLARFSKDPAEADRLIDRAGEWVSTILRDFKGGQGNRGYYFTSDHHEKLIQRPKTVFDQAIPSGTAVTLLALGALAEIDWSSRGAEFEKELEAQLAGLFHLGERSAHGTSELLSAALQWLIGPAAVSGNGGGQYLASPWVFQKGPDARAPGLLLCRKHACAKAPLKEELFRQLQLR
jgi:hypothetical protein